MGSTRHGRASTVVPPRRFLDHRLATDANRRRRAARRTGTTAAPPKNWLTPTQAAGRARVAVTKAKPSSQAAPSTLRAPKPFVPPADAQQLAATPKPVATNAASAAPVVAKSQSGTNVNKSAAQVRQPGARDAVNQAQTGRVAPRSPHDRVAYRPRPTSTGGTQLFADNWIRPLKQVAYQAGEAEELYAPPGKIPPMPIPGDEAAGPEIPSDGEWIGSPDGPVLRRRIRTNVWRWRRLLLDLRKLRAGLARSLHDWSTRR